METQVSEKKSRAEDLSSLFDLESKFSVISGDDLIKFQNFSQKNNVSGSVVLIAAFATLMFRYQNEQQYQIKVRLGKSSLQNESEIFDFKLRHDLSICELIADVNASVKKNRRWKWLTNLSNEFTPFFCSIVSAPDQPLAMSALFESSISNSLIINNSGFDQKSIPENWFEHITVLIKDFCDNPTTDISLLKMLSEKEMERLGNWSVSLVDKQISSPSTLPQLFENTARAFGHKAALQCRGEQISYKEFNGRSNSLARFLQSRGVKKGSFVAILLPRSENVFIAIMGVLKAGAAYVPIDPRSPADRISYILQDADVKTVITDSMLQKQNGLSGDCIIMEDLTEELKKFSTENLSSEENNLTPDDPAYVIYTSGTTGKPKGVVLLHRTVCNLIRGESYLFKVNHKDRVFQGFSVSFDASVEEMWLAWYSGALLVAATKSEALSGPDLVKFLNDQKVTVFSTVPTQISMMQTPVESVRILILGGEECHLKAIDPWLDGKRKVFNTYGPTEATVIATCGECRKGIKPSIGRPAPNYAVFILDSNLQPVAPGMTGELCIGGHCLAKEYLKRDELTTQKFITPSFDVGNGFPQRLYRSGDRARFAPDGSIQFAGRIDDQVKLRGQRIELGEIEETIVKSTQARQVAVALNTNAQNIQSLVAYIVPEDGKKIDEKELRNSLKNFLPSYMIPGQFLFFDELPVLPSGKIDRKKLPSLNTAEIKVNRNIIAPRNSYEKLIHEIWQKYFDRKDISVIDDFFDIGGHSLLAATIVSELRNADGMKDLPLQHIYQYRTIEALASVLQKETANRPSVIVDEMNEVQSVKNTPGRRWKSAVCSLFQTIALYPIFMLFSTPLIIPFIIDFFNPEIEVTEWVIVSFAAMLLLLPAVITMSIIGKWLIIGRFKPGSYPLWGFFYIRFWFVSRLMDLVPTRIMRGTPFLTWYYRLLGAKIGRNVHMGSDRFRVCDMISIGNNTCINADAHLMAYKVSNGMVHIGPITIGKNCTVGTRSVLSENSGMEDFSELAELSLLPSGATVGSGEHWEGSPAAKVNNTGKSNREFEEYAASLKPTISYKIAFSLAFLLVLILPVFLLIPWTIVAFTLYVNNGLLYTLASTIPLAALYTISFCVSVAVVKKILLPKDGATSYPVYSKEYIRKWVVDTLVQLSLMTVQPLYATIFLPLWLRMLGAKIGKRAEISTVDHITADLLSVEEGSFVADSASVGPAVVRNGAVHVGKTVVGKRSFVGNSALIPIGTNIGDNCLIGVLSKPPQECAYQTINDTNWLGSPPIILPKRQESQQFELKKTFEPPFYMVILRGIVEFFKITVPPALTSCCFIYSYWFMSEILGPVASLVSYILFCPVVIFGSSLFVTMVTVILKWLLVGRYRQLQKPLWSLFVWKNEFINSLCENLAFPLLLQMIQGTPFLPAFFRLLGSRIGKNVFMETTEITEFDLVYIDDNASLNYGCTIQTHLFEDRVMKMSNLYIGKNATVGPMSVVLYDSSMKNGAVLDGLSLLMKGETLPSSTAWFGIPARSQANIGS
jgi:non-ribosomal peptide synthetase-like protein